MTMLPALFRVTRITLFPIKSLDGIEVTEATITTGGALRYDREFGLVGADGRLLRAKETPALHRIRATYDLAARRVSLTHAGDAREQSFHLDYERAELARWFSNVLQEPVQLMQDVRTGVPDDPNFYGPTLIASPTLASVASWFPGVGESEMRRRLRANIEFDAALPFAEDTLVGDGDTGVALTIGDVRLGGAALCARCAVPARDSRTGEQDGTFARQFAKLRGEGMPAWSQGLGLKHHYYLCVRTHLGPDQAGKQLCVGDAVQRIGEDPAIHLPRRYKNLWERVAELAAAAD